MNMKQNLRNNCGTKQIALTAILKRLIAKDFV